MNKIIAFITYESHWFHAGGIAAVMGQLPSATEVAAQLPTVVVTPFHCQMGSVLDCALGGRRRLVKKVTTQVDRLKTFGLQPAIEGFVSA